MLTDIQKMNNRDQVGAELQAKVNLALNLQHDEYLAKQIVVVAMIASHADYPQYNHRWDSTNARQKAKLVMLKHDVKTKFGTAFLKGDFALAIPPENNELSSFGWTLCSLRNGFVETLVHQTQFQFV